MSSTRIIERHKWTFGILHDFEAGFEMTRKSDERRAEMAAIEFLNSLMAARSAAVAAMAALETRGKGGSDAYIAAMNLDADAQRLMHGRFEV